MSAMDTINDDDLRLLVREEALILRGYWWV